MDIKKIFNGSQRIDSVIVVDISSKLTFVALELKATVRVSALKIIALSDNERDKNKN